MTGMKAFYVFIPLLPNNGITLFGRFYNTVVLWNCSSVLWTNKLNLTFSQHEGEKLMTEFSFLGELPFKHPKHVRNVKYGSPALWNCWVLTWGIWTLSMDNISATAWPIWMILAWFKGYWGRWIHFRVQNGRLHWMYSSHIQTRDALTSIFLIQISDCFLRVWPADSAFGRFWFSVFLRTIIDSNHKHFCNFPCKN